MIESAQYLKAERAKLAPLKKILQDMDPASGVSISIRRGVPQDNEDVDDDAIRRPWVTVSTGNIENIRPALLEVVKQLEANIAFWEKTTQRDIAEAQKILENNP